MYDQLEQAIEAAQEAQQAIIAIEATKSNKATLDAAYNALRDSIEQLTKLLEPCER